MNIYIYIYISIYINNIHNDNNDNMLFIYAYGYIHTLNFRNVMRSYISEPTATDSNSYESTFLQRLRSLV